MAVARRDGLPPRETTSLVELWRRTTDPEARQYLLAHPRAALELAGGKQKAPVDPRLGEAGRQLLGALVTLAQVALRARRRVDDGLGALPAEGLAALRKARDEAGELCESALDAVKHWLAQQESVE